MASPDPGLKAAGRVLTNQPVYAHLGAVGATLADFIPSDPPPPGPSLGAPNQLTALWKSIFGVVGGDGTPANPGLLTILKKFENFLNQIVPIADAENLGALKALRDSGEITDITNTANALKDIVTAISSPTGVAVAVASSIGAGLKPAVNVPAGSAVPPPVVWTAREFMHWKRPGAFAQALLARASASGDERFQAYAFGYLTSFVTKVCGSPFINSSIGAPYRNQWWRYRWINNYVDAWVFGYYAAGASMAGDTPNPPYSDPRWANLCDAGLQKKIELGGIDAVDLLSRMRQELPFPAVLPDDFSAFWFQAFTDAYGAPPLGSRFKAAALNGAYLMTWMTLWFQTSGEVIGCNPAPPMTPPGDCGVAPSWSDPSVPGDNGTGSTPPAPEVESDPDVGEIVSGVLLALLGIGFGAAGGLWAGGITIAAGVDLIIDGASQIDWAKLRCDLYWYRMYLYNGLKALHELLAMAALRYPYAAELANPQTTLTLLGIPFKFDSGLKNVKSRSLRDGYPAARWDGALGSWVQRPTSPYENPQTVGYPKAQYPSFFVDDDVLNPIANGDVKTGGTWPPGYGQDPKGDVVQFGNAVANSLDLFANLKATLPDWNLDADRGLAYLTWVFRNGVYSDPVLIDPEP
jgi:hypothetical protein